MSELSDEVTKFAQIREKVLRSRDFSRTERNSRKTKKRADPLQAANVPSVVGDQRYAELVEWQCTQSQSDYEKALQQTIAGEGAKAQPTQRAQAKRPRAPTPPAAPVDLTDAADANVGDQVVVRQLAWPAYTCTENGGAGWCATVKSATGVTVVVRFHEARSSDGRAYEDMRVPRVHIARLAQGPN